MEGSVVRLSISVILSYIIICSLNAQEVIIKDRIPEAEIIISETADSTTVETAKILQEYLHRMTGVRIKISNAASRDCVKFISESRFSDRKKLII
jgi:hypothetical protein